MTVHPEVLWAQRSSATQEEKNVLFITINLPGILKDTLQYNLTPDSLSFKAKSYKDESEDYAFSIDFYSEVVPESSNNKLSDRSFNLVIRKKDVKLEYWPRLTKEKIRNSYIKTDFSKWADEDEQDGTDEKGVNDEMDFGGMGGLGGGDFGGGGFGGGGLGGGMDFEKMMADMEKNKSAAGGSTELDEDSDNSDDGGPPPLEEGGSTQ